MPVSRHIELTIKEDNISAIAKLLEEDAPLTCAALWNALETPIVHKGIHAMWTGFEIMVEIPPENHRFDPLSVPLETQAPPPGGDPSISTGTHKIYMNVSHFG